MEKKKFSFGEKDIVQNGLLAALDVVLTYVMAPISFQAIQFRLSEVLVLNGYSGVRRAWSYGCRLYFDNVNQKKQSLLQNNQSFAKCRFQILEDRL